MGGLADAIKAISFLDGVVVEVGLVGVASPGPSTGSELVQIATALEYGTATIPPRPFLRTSLKRNRRRWTNALDKVVAALAAGQQPRAVGMLRLLGVEMVANVQETIDAGPWAPNAESTIRRKGSSRPLIGVSGQLRQSIRSQIRFRNGRTEVLG